MWTIDSGDWQAISPEQVQYRVVSGARNGAIVVSHCNSQQTALVLEPIINELTDKEKKNLTITTVSALLR